MQSIGRDAVLMAPLSKSSPGSYPVVCHRPKISAYCERIHPPSAARLGIERKMKSSGLRPIKRLPRAPRGRSASVPSLHHETRSKTAQKSMWPRSRKRRKNWSGADLAFLWVSNIELRLAKKNDRVILRERSQNVMRVTKMTRKHGCPLAGQAPRAVMHVPVDQPFFAC